MPKQITIALIKIMNWTHTQHDTKIEISFLSAHNKSYIAHKSILGTYIDNTIILNTSFKISYHENQRKLICKIIVLKQQRVKEVVGQAELDLQCFLNRKIQYVAFNDRDKVIEIHRVDDINEENKDQFGGQFVQRDEQYQHNFLQERYNFLDKITHKEIELKKDFSEKVYNLLKDIKYARAAENLRKEFQDKKFGKDKNQDSKFETPNKEEDKFENIKKVETRINQINENLLSKNQLNKPTKPYKLMIDSIQAYGKKQPTREYNIYSKNQYENTQQEEQENIIPIPIRKGNKQLKGAYRH